MVTITANSIQLFNKAFAAGKEELGSTEALEKDVVGMLVGALRGVVPVLKLVDYSYSIHTNYVAEYIKERGVVLGGKVDDRGFQSQKRKIIFLRRDGNIRFVREYPGGGYETCLPLWAEPSDINQEELTPYFTKNEELDLEMVAVILDDLQAVFANAMAKNEGRHAALEQMVIRLTPVVMA